MELLWHCTFFYDSTGAGALNVAYYRCAVCYVPIGCHFPINRIALGEVTKLKREAFSDNFLSNGYKTLRVCRRKYDWKTKALGTRLCLSMYHSQRCEPVILTSRSL